MYLPFSSLEEINSFPVCLAQASISLGEPESVAITLSTCDILSPLIAFDVFTRGMGQESPEQSRTESTVSDIKREFPIKLSKIELKEHKFSN